jgi:sulfopyruvate decarboxylase TPP-binding subunit
VCSWGFPSPSPPELPRSGEITAALENGAVGDTPAAVSAPTPDWPAALFAALLEADVRTVAYVPDAGHAHAIELAEAEPAITAVPLTTEEEGIGYLAGAWLGGVRGVLLMQSSGVGNCINTLALAAQARFPLLMLVTMRGEWAELNPWQNPAGGAAEESLKLMGVRTWRADRSEDVEPLVRGALAMTFAGDMSSALLLGQRLIGSKTW